MRGPAGGALGRQGRPPAPARGAPRRLSRRPGRTVGSAAVGPAAAAFVGSALVGGRWRSHMYVLTAWRERGSRAKGVEGEGEPGQGRGEGEPGVLGNRDMLCCACTDTLVLAHGARL